MKEIVKIVLTGGPCAGKSTTLEALKQKFNGRLLVVPEVATILLSGGFPIPGQHVTHSQEWQSAFQTAVCTTQVSLEQAYELVACEKGINILVCDRGQLDGAAYTPGGIKEFCKLYKINEAQAHKRYKAVIHLESVATANSQLYGKAGNENRYETLDEAESLEHRTRAAWKNHTNWYFVPGNSGIDDVIKGATSFFTSQIPV